ncbi:cytochrome P450 3A9-like [Liolophura sinensis]|uniref:cytochrome P450 3A9-like n=1 Tax=Liolophura sinensis TaxID=3198878 RepID=UPI00315829B7
MDVLGLVNIPVWVLIVLALCFLYYMYSTANFGVFNTMGVPGPKPTVLMGNLREIVKKGFVEMEGEWVKKYGRVYGIFEGRNPILIVGDLDMLKDIMVKHFHSFTNRSGRLCA